jgi:hypothetical protein
MADRTVYGLTTSENGWRMVDQGSCVWVAVPGTNVHLQIREGQPARILGAFVADWNAYIEPVRDADSACWTATNSVASSNHLSGTACDVCWGSHPFRVANAGFNEAQLKTMREMLSFYEGMVFWGNDWQSPKDAMHVQMGYETAGPANFQKVNDFIARKIRADGFSTFRRANNPAPPPPPIPAPAQLSRAEGYALRIMNEGRRRGVTPKGIQIAFATGIVESNITVYANQKLPKSLALPHDAVGNDGYSVGIFQQQVRNTGNGWWWGDEATCMGVESSAGLFYDRLVRLPYNGDSKSPGAFAQQIQGSAFPARYDQHWGEAVALYNKLAGIAPPSQGDDDLSAEAEQILRDLRDAFLTQIPSLSPLRLPGEGNVGTLARILRYMDSNIHVQLVIEDAKLGDPDTLNGLNQIINTDLSRYPDRAKDVTLAKNILAAARKSWGSPTAAAVAAPAVQDAGLVPALQSANAEVARLREENAQLRAQLNTTPEVSAAVAVPGPKTELKSLGDHAGQLVDSVEGWTNAALSMDVKQQAALKASINVLTMQNGQSA